MGLGNGLDTLTMTIKASTNILSRQRLYCTNKRHRVRRHSNDTSPSMIQALSMSISILLVLCKYGLEMLQAMLQDLLVIIAIVYAEAALKGFLAERWS